MCHDNSLLQEMLGAKMMRIKEFSQKPLKPLFREGFFFKNRCFVHYQSDFLRQLEFALLPFFVTSKVEPIFIQYY